MIIASGVTSDTMLASIRSDTEDLELPKMHQTHLMPSFILPPVSKELFFKTKRSQNTSDASDA
jgi:hypothetical protein